MLKPDGGAREIRAHPIRPPNLIGRRLVSDSTLNLDGGTRSDELRSIEVQLASVMTFGYAAIVKLSGEHDLATVAELREALGPIFGDVLVDLSDCSFIDSTTIGILIRDHQTRAREGQRLELYVPAGNAVIVRTLAVSGASDLLGVRPSLP